MLWSQIIDRIQQLFYLYLKNTPHPMLFCLSVHFIVLNVCRAIPIGVATNKGFGPHFREVKAVAVTWLAGLLVSFRSHSRHFSIFIKENRMSMQRPSPSEPLSPSSLSVRPDDTPSRHETSVQRRSTNACGSICSNFNQHAFGYY